MSIINQMTRQNETNKESMPKSKCDLIKEAFLEKANEFWGNVSKIHVMKHKESAQGTVYYLLICENDRNGKKGKLMQEWFIDKKGEARINPKRTMWIDISLVDEVAGILYE